MIGLLRPYQVERLGSFLVGAHESPAGSGWAVRQAHIAVGSGSLYGRTDDPLRLLRAQYLPERETDLALASLVEQWGLIAGAGAVLAAIILVWRLALASRAPRTPHGALVGGGLAILMGVETVVSVGGNLGLLPLAGVPFPLLSYGGTALVVHLAAIGVVLAVRRDGARRRLWALPRWRNPRPRLVRLTALGLSTLLVSFGVYGWRLQSTQGEALLLAGQEQMTRCVRLPASRGSIIDRHDAPLAVNAVDAGSGVDRVHVVPALLLDRPADIDRLAELTGRPRDELHAQIGAAPRTTLSLPVADVPRGVGDAVTAAGIDGVFVLPDPRRAYPSGPLLGPVLGFVGVATPQDEERWPDLPQGETVGRAGLEQQYDAVLRGINGRQCLYVNPRACRRRWASGRTPCRAPTCGSRSTWVCRGSWMRAWRQRFVRSPGRGAGSAPRSRWTRSRGRCSPSRARRRSTTTSTGRPSTPGRCGTFPVLPGRRCSNT